MLEDKDTPTMSTSYIPSPTSLAAHSGSTKQRSSVERRLVTHVYCPDPEARSTQWDAAMFQPLNHCPYLFVIVCERPVPDNLQILILDRKFEVRNANSEPTFRFVTGSSAYALHRVIIM